MLEGLKRSALESGLLGRSALLLGMADTRRDRRNWAEAAALYREYLALRPANAAIWVQFGHALKESGQIVEAEAAYRHALLLRSDVADTHLHLGHILKISGRPDDAADAYARALGLDPTCGHARTELKRLVERGLMVSQETLAQLVFRDTTSANGRRSRSGPGARAHNEYMDMLEIDASEMGGEASQPADAPVIGVTAEPGIVFDVSDLLSYFGRARLPTGIQRVQVECISSLLREQRNGLDGVGICAFAEQRDRWVQIPQSLFLRLSDLCLQGGGLNEEAWAIAVDQATMLLRRAKPMKFGKDAAIVNLGTSWWLQNYFLNVRNAKAECGIRYLPFVHDLIPIITPEHCIKELTEDFVTWILGVFDHADHFLVNSKATRADLLRVAQQLGQELSEDTVTVVPLNADFRKSTGTGLPPERLATWGLTSGNYVLFVATIESRKNHLGAFSAWLALVAKHGSAQIPKLVCVGNQGWLNGPVYSTLDASDTLRSHVVMLSGLPDDELALLYDHCLFTLYPSHYEGWGLPITESLCHGKVPLVSTAPPLRESGGEFADYFETGSDSAMTEAIERLVFDPAYRRKRERHISDSFRPRSWSDIGVQVMEAADRSRETPGARSEDRNQAPMTAAFGTYYPTKRNTERRIWPSMKAGEMFRTGWGWWGPEDWGTWTKPGGGEITLRISGPHPRLRCYFGLSGLVREPCGWAVEFSSPPAIPKLNGTIQPRDKLWVTFELPESNYGTVCRAIVRGQKSQDMDKLTEGVDTRLTSIGFRGFFVCEYENAVARADFVEAILFDDLSRLEAGAKMRND